MAKKIQYLLCCLLLAPLCIQAENTEPDDFSKAGTDGPYVSFQGKKILVRNLEERDTTVVINARTFERRPDVLLTCSVPQASDYFTFGLHDSLVIPAWEYPMPEKILVISDIEGNFQAFKQLLLGAKAIDQHFNWTFGNGHLVLLGDFFDRGLNVTECLWLIYKLEQEAAKAGGTVHFIVGNHELLNLAGNHQYTRRKYLDNAQLLGESYADLFSVHTELGRWLRTKNAVERIGDYVFCHGGISPDLAASGISLAEVNDVARLHYGVPERFISDAKGKVVMNSATGIFWYRGASKNKLGPEEINAVMAYAGADHMVVGHTLMPDVTALYGGKVICTDLYHDENLRNGVLKTLYIENGFAYSLENTGMKSTLFYVMFSKND